MPDDSVLSEKPFAFMRTPGEPAPAQAKAQNWSVIPEEESQELDGSARALMKTAFGAKPSDICLEDEPVPK